MCDSYLLLLGLIFFDQLLSLLLFLLHLNQLLFLGQHLLLLPTHLQQRLHLEEKKKSGEMALKGN